MKILISILTGALAFASVATGQTLQAQSSVKVDAQPVRVNTSLKAEADLNGDGKVDAEERAQAQNKRQEMRDKYKEARAETKEKAVETRANFREGQQQLKERRQEFVAEVKEDRNELQTEAKAKRDELKAKLEAAETDEERAEIRAEAAAEREAFKEKAKEAKQERKEQAQSFIKERAELMISRLTAMNDRGTQIHGRLVNALAELEEQGVDVLEARAFLAAAIDYRDSATVNISAAGEQVRIAVNAESTEDARTALSEAKRYMKAAHEDIKAMYQELRKSHKALKEAIKDVRAEVSAETETDVASQ